MRQQGGDKYHWNSLSLMSISICGGPQNISLESAVNQSEKRWMGMFFLFIVIGNFIDIQTELIVS